MKQACEMVRREHSDLPVSFSFEPKDRTKLAGKDLKFLDFADPHLWLAQANGNEFSNQIGYKGGLLIWEVTKALSRKQSRRIGRVLITGRGCCATTFCPVRMPSNRTGCRS